MSTEPGRRLTVYLSTRDHVGHHALVSELITRARRVGVAGATVFHGAEGFGASERLHRPHLVGHDEPVRVVVVDTPEQIERFRDAIDDLLGDTAVVTDDLEIVTP